MENKIKKEKERLWHEIFLLQAENAALRRKLGEDYRDFSYYRSFCELEKVVETDNPSRKNRGYTFQHQNTQQSWAPGACGINSNSIRKIWKYE
jgi:hypothetical protein